MSEHPDGGDELAALRALGARAGSDPVRWETPPPDLWARIAEQAGVDPDLAPPTGESPRSDEDHGTAPRPGAVVELDRRRRPFPLLLTAAAALVLLAGVVAVAVLAGRDPEPTVVASSALDLLPGDGEGHAELVEVDGRLRLRVDLAGVEPDDGFLEVWLIDPEVTQLVSLGPVREDGLYDLPPTIDPKAFPIVDVSIEPLDGDPTHSGNSVLRGQLTF